MWRCTHCRKEYQESSGTAVITTHLLKAHLIRINSVQTLKITDRQGSIKDTFKQTEDYKRRCLPTVGIVSTTVLNPAVVERLYIQSIIACEISFRIIKRDEFRV